IKLDWAACEQMQRIANSQPKHLWPSADPDGDAEPLDWQRYRAGQRWPGAYAWLVVLCIATFALIHSLPHSLSGVRGQTPGAPAWVVIQSCVNG
ncbi:hypothetical protein, partial [Pseudomonas viridiflava]|uniref:hypothetical protein n=1 Tax=Pseudomonas viridiflava TaxID=33069 RepID=UPI0013E06513